MSPQPIYVDRSRYLDGRNCQRLRGLAYEAPNAEGEPRGWSPAKKRHYFEVGSTLHEALERVILGDDPDEVAASIWQFTEDPNAFDWGQGQSTLPPSLRAREAATWIEAAMWCWITERLPWFQETFTVEAVERELQMPLGSIACPCKGETLDCRLCHGDCARLVIWCSRPDVIPRRRLDSGLFVLDWKSSGFKEDAASIDLTLQHKVLVYAQIATVEHAYQEPVMGYLYEGFYKGQNKMDNRLGFKRRYSPLAWAYCMPADGLTKASVDPENWRLGLPRLLKDLPGWTIKDYVQQVLTPAQRQAQLMYSVEAIGANPLHVERWKQQVLAQEAQWQAWHAAGANLEDLAQNDDHCMRHRGEPCMHLAACWDEAVRADPVGSGKFQPRVPNHQPEADWGKSIGG